MQTCGSGSGAAPPGNCNRARTAGRAFSTHRPSWSAGGPEHIYELANERYDRLVGGRALIGKPVREALPEIIGQGFIDLLEQVYRTGETFVATDERLAIAPADGRPVAEHHVDLVFQPLRDPEGAVTGIIVQGIDLTARTAPKENSAIARSSCSG